MKKILLTLLLASSMVMTACSSSNGGQIGREEMAQLSVRAMGDLNYIFKNLNSSKFTSNPGFSEQLNENLEEIIVTDILMEKLQNAPKTQTVIGLTKHDAPKIKKLATNNIEVTITGVGDSYWLVDGEKSSLPGEKVKENISENYPATYILEYKKTDSGYTLVNFEDDNGQQLGASRTWKGKPELMKKYRENPNLIK